MAWRLSVATVSTARVLFVTGKGGVGKTTVAELLAKAAGIGGRPARLIDTCGRSDDGSDDRAVVEALITRLVGLRAVSRRMLDSRSFQALLAAIPGLVDIARLDAIRRLSKKERVVVDGPASGQAAAMLLAPARLERLALVGPVRRLASELARFVADPAKVSVVVVASPEEMAIAEARETCRDLASQQIAHRVLVNGVYPRRVDAEQEAWLVQSAVSGDALLHLARRKRQLDAVAGLDPVPYSIPFSFSDEPLATELGREFLGGTA